VAARPGRIAVEIVAPDASDIVARIGEARLNNAKSVVAHNMKFEDYLSDVLASDIPDLMKKAAADHQEIREWMQRIPDGLPAAGAGQDESGNRFPA
jgi:hypothetical protein